MILFEIDHAQITGNEAQGWGDNAHEFFGKMAELALEVDTKVRLRGWATRARSLDAHLIRWSPEGIPVLQVSVVVGGYAAIVRTTVETIYEAEEAKLVIAPIIVEMLAEELRKGGVIS